MMQAHFPFAQALPLTFALVAGLSACNVAAPPAPDPVPEAGVDAATRNGPADAPPGTCWGKTVSPAVIERVSEQIQISPAEVNSDGTIGKLPVYRTESRQVIVTPRKNNWFETPCPDVLTPEFVSSLQRALTVRGVYAGAITGDMDADTQTAIRTLQRQTGTDSGVLSLQTARALGLVAIDRSTLE